MEKGQTVKVRETILLISPKTQTSLGTVQDISGEMPFSPSSRLRSNLKHYNLYQIGYLNKSSNDM